MTNLDNKCHINMAKIRTAFELDGAINTHALPTIAGLAHSIAYSYAVSDIECNCQWLEIDGQRWYNTAKLDDETPETVAIIADACAYLCAIGHLKRLLADPAIVRIEKPASYRLMYGE